MPQSTMTRITESIEYLSLMVSSASDDDLMYHHISLLRSLATRIQHRLERNDVRQQISKFNQEEGCQ